MPIAVMFRKDQATEILNTIATHGAIKPPHGEWIGNDLLNVAAACLFAATTHGPESFFEAIPEDQHPEHVEAAEETFLTDIVAAVEVLAEFMSQVNYGTYDEHFEPKVHALIGKETETNSHIVTFAEGKKGD